MSKEKLEKEYKHNIGSPLYDDIDWIYKQAEIFKNRYDEKRAWQRKHEKDSKDIIRV